MFVDMSDTEHGRLAPTGSDTRGWDEVRADFRVLDQEINGQPLAYLDSSASSQQPWQVIEAQVEYLTSHHSNVHRGVHDLSQRATTSTRALAPRSPRTSARPPRVR